MLRRSLVLLAPIALLAACAQQLGAVYQLPMAEARQILMYTELPPMVFGSQPPDGQVFTQGDDVIIWVGRRGGVELFRYVAHLEAEGGKATRVKVELKGTDGADGTDKKLNENPRIRDLYLAAMNERVASALEKRKFDLTRIYPQMTAASVANMGRLQASADEAAAASEKEERETMERAYREEAEGVRR